MFTAGEGYERFMGRWSRLLVPEYIAFAGLRDGERVLDVGTGTGSVAFMLTAAMPACEVVAVDPSEALVAHAKGNTPASRVRFEVGDAQALRYEDGVFDQALSLLVLNFVPDPARAISEMRRVTRPRGTVSAGVWDYDAGMQMLRFFWDEAVALDPAAEPRDERHMKLCREGQLGALWRKAGLADVREQALTIEQRFTSFDDYWAPFLKGVGPAGAYVVSLSEERRSALDARLRARLLGGRPDGAFTLNARAWCVRGTVPGG